MQISTKPHQREFFHHHPILVNSSANLLWDNEILEIHHTKLPTAALTHDEQTSLSSDFVTVLERSKPKVEQLHNSVSTDVEMTQKDISTVVGLLHNHR